MRISCGRWRLLIVFNLALLSACSPDVPEAVVETPAAKAEPLGALPPLRTGTRALAAGTPLAGSLKANFKDQTHEYLEIALPAGGDLSGADRQLVELDNSTPGDLAVLEIDATSSAGRILVRRRIGVAAHPGGALYLSRWRESQ